MTERSVASIPLALVACLLGGAGCLSGRASEAPPAQKPVKVRVVPVTARSLQRSVEAVGSLFPFEEVTVSSEVEGRIDQVYVDVGDRVAPGRPLVRIVRVELGLALDQEQAALRQIESRLAPPEGQSALDGRARRGRGEAGGRRTATDAEQKFRRAKELWRRRGSSPAATFDEAEARYSSARAAYDMALQNVQHLRAQAAQRSASVALAQKKLGDTRDPRALRRPGEGAAGQPGAVREGADPGDGGGGQRPAAGAAQGAREDGGLGRGRPAGDRAGRGLSRTAASAARSRASTPRSTRRRAPSRSRPCSRTRTAS